MPLLPIPRGEGSFAAFLRDRRDKVFGEDYEYDGGHVPDLKNGGCSSANWRIRALPLAARVNLVSEGLASPVFFNGSDDNAVVVRCSDTRLWQSLGGYEHLIVIAGHAR